jgi:Uma2 family endonuclease
VPASSSGEHSGTAVARFEVPEGWFAGAGPAAGVPFTVADLERTPDDGRRYELLDGTLVVSPRPAIGHQRIGFRLAYALEAGCPDGLIVVPEPAVQVNARTELAPDIVVAREEWIVDPDLERPELTVFELRDGHYGLEAQTTQTITLERPFPVTITLASLTRGPRR